MDIFDSDDEGDTPKLRVTAAAAMLNEAYIELMRIRPAVKKSVNDDAALIYHREVSLLIDNDVVLEGLQLLSKLEKAHFKSVKYVEFNDVADLTDHIGSLVRSDVIVLVEKSPRHGVAAFIGQYVSVGASVLSVCSESSYGDLYPSDRWITEKASKKPLSNIIDENTNSDNDVAFSFLSIRKRGVRVNPTAAMYWGKSDEAFLARERQLVDDLTVHLSMAERRLGIFSDSAHKKAVYAMNKHGLCIFPGLFARDEIMSWGTAALDDMQSALVKLRERDIDLLRPGEGPRIENFHELSMREALRCDLRNGRAVKAKLAAANAAATAGGGGGSGSLDVAAADVAAGAVKDAAAAQLAALNNTAVKALSHSHDDEQSTTKDTVSSAVAVAVVPQQQQQQQQQQETAVNKNTNHDSDDCDNNNDNAAGIVSGPSTYRNIRQHPGILGVLLDFMNPMPEDLDDVKGNWGRWNFEGSGPTAPPELAVGQIGCVMSLPGCADQTIHADTPHIYVHTQLPAHYVNLFMPASGEAVDDNPGYDFKVAQTVYIAGSHDLKTSAKIMTQEGGQEDLEARLIRPHLQAGDAVLWDCRVLHFGTANQATYTAEERNDKGELSFCRDSWRPVLYVNYHQKWFHDPKNWNDKEKLFN